MQKSNIKAWLDKEEFNAAINFARFVKGCYCFALGLMVIIWTNQLLPASIQAELISLLGLIVMILGTLLALRGYLSFSLFRLLRYFFKD